MFPVNPDLRTINEDGLFIVQDEKLTSTILPLYSFSADDPNARPDGHGTTFRIDPWSRCATAYHVIEDLVTVSRRGEIAAHPERRLVSLELPEVSYGINLVGPENWRGLTELFSIFAKEEQIFADARAKNFCELAVLRLRPNGQITNNAPYLPVRLSGWYPAAGEPVMAFGYADLDLDKKKDGDTRPIEQRLYGSRGRITQIDPADGESSRPWPRIWVEADWPGGMSGGPVFNAAGEVIGLVSSAFNVGERACATFFSGWNVPQHIYGSLDALNPGWFKVVGAFDSEGNLRVVGQGVEEVREMARSENFEVAMVTYNPSDGSYMRPSG
ncbi:serine protease [Rhizobium leguminosarum]|uniref:Serine protease n=1 Tax=Rhizobium leguminosarum TaxID=384 RepID=A0A4Q8Y0J5_RHILE|nr:serine protease [Rhizobium leguminosarum]TAX72809.1 serine protease [Rhizobium leguminosarum]